MLPAVAPTTLVRTAESATPSPRVKSTPRSRSLVVIRLPTGPRTPKTARIPSRTAPSQPIPASTRLMKAMTPVIVNAAARGAHRDESVGVLRILHEAWQVRVQVVSDRVQHLGVPPQDEPEHRERERDGGEDREEGEIPDTPGQNIAPCVAVALPRPPGLARPKPCEKRLHGRRPGWLFNPALKSKLRTERHTRSSPCSYR